MLLLLNIFSGFISGICTALALPPLEQTYTLLIAFVPAFYLIDKIADKPKWKIFPLWLMYCFCFMASWTSISFHWLIDISWGTFALAFSFATLVLTTITFPLFFIQSAIWRKLIFVFTFVLYEIWGFRSELSTPYTTVGPWLTSQPLFSQYYSILGIPSGTFWILMTNLLLYEVLFNRSRTIKTYNRFIFAIVLLFPISSLFLYFAKSEKEHHLNIALANTKIDPFDNTYGVDEAKVRAYLDHQFKDVRSSKKIDLLIYPEGVTNHLGWVGNESNENHIRALNDWRKERNIQSLLIGGLMYQQVFSTDEHYSVQEKDGYYYTTHNVSLQIQDEGYFVQSKEYFVPFQEYIPYPKFFMGLSDKVKNVGYKSKISPLSSSHPHVGKFTTLICYEAFKPSPRITNRDDDFIVVVASESWTKSKTAHRQFNQMLQAIALKNNKTLVKSSNYGTSLIVNNLGQVKHSFSNEKVQLINI